MTTDTGSLHVTAIERAVKAVNEAQQERARLRRVLVTAIILIAAGALVAVAANIAVTVVSDGRLDWVDTWKGMAHAVGVSGVVLLASWLVIVVIRRGQDKLMARIGKLERRQEFAAHQDDRDVVDPQYLADMSEAVRLGEEIERRKHQPPEQQHQQ